MTKENGELDVWDYYFKGQFEPAFTVKISEQHSLSDVKLSMKGGSKYAAVGCADGSVTVLELCKSLYESSNLNAEKAAMSQLFERETLREKTLQAAKLAQRRALKQKNKNKGAKGGTAKKETEPQRDFDLADFGAVEKDFLSFIEQNRPKKEDIMGDDDDQENDESAGNM